MATPPVAQRATLFVPILDDCVILSEPPFLFADLDGTPFTYRGQAEELTHTHALATAQQLTVHISAPTISTFHPHLVQSQQGLIRNVLLCRGSLPTRLNVRLTDNPAMTQTSRWYHEQVTLTLPRDQIQALTVGTVYDETPRSNGDITWFLDRAGRVFANVMYLELHACSGGLPAPTSDPRCPLPPLFPSLKHCVIVHPVSDVVICSLPPYVSRLETLDIQYMKHENTEITPCDKIFTSAHQATQLRSFKTNAVLGGKPAQYLMLYAPNIRELVVGRLGQMLEDSVYLRHIERFTVLRGSVYADMMVRFIRRLDLNVTTIVLPSELKLRVSHRDLETSPYQSFLHRVQDWLIHTNTFDITFKCPHTNKATRDTWNIDVFSRLAAVLKPTPTPRRQHPHKPIPHAAIHVTLTGDINDTLLAIALDMHANGANLRRLVVTGSNKLTGVHSRGGSGGGGAARGLPFELVVGHADVAALVQPALPVKGGAS